MMPDANPSRQVFWVTAGLTLVIGLAGYWYIDTRSAQFDAASLRRLRDAPLPMASGSSRSSDWPQWRGPARDGVSTETGLLTDWSLAGPPLVWKASSGLGYSSVAVANGRVFTLLQEGDEEAAVCWDAETGQEQWRFHYACPRLALDYGNGPRATPIVDGDCVYFLGTAGALHCLSAGDGRKRWHHDLADEFGGSRMFANRNFWGYACSPLVDGERLFTATGGTTANALAAFDKHTGERLWKGHDDPLSYSSPLAVTIDGRRQIVFFTGSGLVGVVPEDGAALWRYPWETNDRCNIATPIASGNYLFISSGYDRGCALLEIAHNGGSWTAGLVYAHKQLRNHFSTSVLYQDHLYGFDNTMLVCMEFRTGKVCWRQAGFRKGSLLIADGHLLILAENGQLACATATSQEYRETSSFTVASGRFWSVPALANGRLYLRAQEQLLCFDLRKR